MNVYLCKHSIFPTPLEEEKNECMQMNYYKKNRISQYYAAPLAKCRNCVTHKYAYIQKVIT